MNIIKVEVCKLGPLYLHALCDKIDASLFNRGALKYQSNVETHPPGCTHNNLSSWTNHNAAGEKGAEFSGAPQTVCQEEARFQPHFPQVCLPNYDSVIDYFKLFI